MNQRLKVQSDESSKLIRDAINGDMEAFNKIHYRTYPILKYFFSRWDIHYTSLDDLIQETFLRLWQQRRKFRAESSFLTFILGIARNVINEEIRRSRKIVKDDLKKQPGSDRYSCNCLSQPEAMYYFKELTATFEEIKAELTLEQREALEISQSVDVTLSEKSNELGCSHKALERRLHRARKKIRMLIASFIEDI